METKVIFDVLQHIRYDVMGKLTLNTPAAFSALDEKTKNKLYREIFDAIMDTNETLTALMTIEKNYRQMNSK